VGGCLLTGNEDGLKHCAMSILFSLQHIGYTIPPQADAGWIGEVGPGPSYLDPGSGGPENDFTNRNTSFMTYNLMHLAAMLRREGGIPARGHLRPERDAGSRMDTATPAHSCPSAGRPRAALLDRLSADERPDDGQPARLSGVPLERAAEDPAQ